MATKGKILLNHNLKRAISTTFVNSSAKSFRVVSTMKKFLKRDVGKRKWYETKQHPSSSPLETVKLTSSHVSRRRTVLNKLFMQHITDLMATGEASTYLLGRSIEITHVNVTADFQTVLVYWGSKNGTNISQTEKILNDCAWRIRHELTQLRVIGQVPIIKFVKNKQLAELTELERRFNVADYGDDYEPIVLQPVKKTELTLSIKLPPDVKEKILQLEKEVEEEIDEDFHVDMPPMRHDVLGLDHHAMMTRIKASLKKSHDAAKNRFLNADSTFPTEPYISTAIDGIISSKEDSQAFIEFLQKRQIQERRKLRRENKETVLEYNNRTIDVSEEDDCSSFLEKEDKDIDIFEDIKLESLK